ncbi:DUF4253 domain-containing protein [Streptomyces sp. CBMA29]|uniref:DUF4253 domain-containing protein n=1 Tax=Streptomyces sp. CBMA29 TaxID=1896314 RepID=UPI001661EE91|nr:DUF4253 domain-containing protein [Streptomyces sp. CBMA29]
MHDAVVKVIHEFGLEKGSIERSISPGGAVLEGFRCPQSSIRQMWRRLRDVHAQTGLWPFVSHDSPEDWEWDSGADAGILHGQNNTNDDRACGEARSALNPSGDTVSQVVAAGLSDNPKPYAYGEIAKSYFHRQPEWIILTEAERSFTLPAVLNAPSVPHPSESTCAPSALYGYHVAVLREWYERYGATVYYIGSSAVVLDVANPPLSLLERARVAVEQVEYCGDLSQVIGDSFDIAERQAPSHQWFFWWD